jgi:hypothetical protein
MNCEQVQALLSRFHDAELDLPRRAAVEIHLGTCPSCAADLAAVAEVGAWTRTPGEAPPAALWQRIVPGLPRARFPWVGRAAVAVVVLVGLVAGWLVYSGGKNSSPLPPAADAVVDLGPLLDDLVAGRSGPAVSFPEATRQVDFHVLDRDQLPEGYCRQGCCLCRCGCCDLVECKYLRGSEPLLLLQGKADQSVAFGDRPMLQTRVHGKSARIVQCSGRLAASWQARGSLVYLVGPTDLSELVRLMAFVDQGLDGQR